MRFFYDRNHKMCTKSVILSVMIMLLTAPLSGCFSSDAMADNVNHDLPDPDPAHCHPNQSQRTITLDRTSFILVM